MLRSTEWDAAGDRRVRAEVMTFMPDAQCSPSDVIREWIDLPGAWWDELRRTLDVLAPTPTSRSAADQQKVSKRVAAVFGAGAVPRIDEWETVHGDLHWSNLLAPRFGLLDGEMWGRGPAGTDAATLYLYSLLLPPMAQHIQDVFADSLDTPAGHAAQVYVAARLLSRADQDFPDLAPVLRRHIQPVIDRVQ